ncbi:polyprenyl synthetase family protein [Clostridium thermobutyricum]|uniref:polyprenyl synthetase family protein n=1 Tax=Clostridium thermobutyricum TaxID=29372 RepID=UPI0018AC5DB6|nr:farnesyl diphosphate synthase [Clostridium thermobutyricum]
MYINEYKAVIDNYLEEYFKGKDGFNKLIYEAESYSLNIGGKRIRPILILLGYNSYKKDYKKALDIACAMEMIHTYSLIHDDLPCMDDDDLRRGKKTNHKVFGENMAVLAGDALLNEAMILIMKSSLENGDNFLKAGLNIAKASGADGMIGGQVVDILSEGKNISIEELKYMHEKKTGALIKASIVSGAIMGGASKEELYNWEKYGENLGLAFQIKDDILDVVGNEQKLGKRIHVDEEKNKTNYISKYGLEKCKEMCRNLTEECIEILKSLNKNTELLEELTINLLKREY